MPPRATNRDNSRRSEQGQKKKKSLVQKPEEFWTTYEKPKPKKPGTGSWRKGKYFHCNIVGCADNGKKSWNNLGRHLEAHGKPEQRPDYKLKRTQCPHCHKSFAEVSLSRHWWGKNNKSLCPNPPPRPNPEQDDVSEEEDAGEYADDNDSTSDGSHRTSGDNSLDGEDDGLQELDLEQVGMEITDNNLEVGNDGLQELDLDQAGMEITDNNLEVGNDGLQELDLDQAGMEITDNNLEVGNDGLQKFDLEQAGMEFTNMGGNKEEFNDVHDLRASLQANTTTEERHTPQRDIQVNTPDDVCSPRTTVLDEYYMEIDETEEDSEQVLANLAPTQRINPRAKPRRCVKRTRYSR